MCSNFSVRASTFRDNRAPIQFNGLLNDRYRILKPLGQGGFGKTFLAVDEQQGAEVFCVIKQLVPPENSIICLKASELFHQEAKLLAELGEHPQIPQLLDTFEQYEQAFIVQEWIDGWTLEQEIAGTVPFDEVEILKVLRAILPVLQYCHDLQIIHRDLKPANIIRRRKDRQLVLVDFGAAKNFKETGRIYKETLIGSAEYASPEQIRGHAIFASDLYSVGVICLYLLTQMSPFDLYDIGEDKWKWQMYLTHPINPLLEEILCKLVQPATRRRYHLATEVLADLYSLPYSPKELSADLDFSSTSTQVINTNLGFPISPAKTAKDDIPALAQHRETDASDFAYKVSMFLRPRLIPSPDSFIQENRTLSTYSEAASRHSLKSTKKSPIDEVFSMMSVLILTCIGSMTMICFFLLMDRRPIQNSAPLPSLQSIPVK